MMKPETQKILEILTYYLTENPEIRFTQALFNLEINQFAAPKNPSSMDYLFRDNHSDLDKHVLERMQAKAHAD